MKELINCTICPHKCKVNRIIEQLGRCKVGSKVKVALTSLHMYEEPCISGEKGSGTVFFGGCNLKCIYCQNYKISHEEKGEEIEISELAEKFINLQKQGALNINLVTPTMYAYHIIEAIKIAKKQGLNIPIIYNTNGYESIETLKALEGYIDVYLPDLKYYYNDIAFKYSKIKNYFEIATEAIKEMYRQVGAPVLNEQGIIQRGLIVRHLILPNHVENSIEILRWINENLSKDIFISIMAQYFPTYLAKEDEKLNRKITKDEYERVENYLYSLNLENGYIQELGEHEEEYVPDF